MRYQFFLASSSPRRKELINLLQIPYKIIVPEIDETLDDHLSLSDQCVHLSKLKAEKVKSEIQKNSISAKATIILAADTLVGIDQKKLEKPKDKIEAKQMLKLLSGKKHNVVTGVSILHTTDFSHWSVQTISALTTVTFHDLSDELIEFYLDSGDGMDKAGGYGIQGFAQCFIKSIEGTYSNVVGLPIDLIVQFLEQKISTGKQNWKELIF